MDTIIEVTVFNHSDLYDTFYGCPVSAFGFTISYIESGSAPSYSEPQKVGTWV